MAAQAHVLLAKRERDARSDLDLRAHEVDAGHELGHGVLDLDAGVHLEEEEVALRVDEALDRARADVADRLRRGDRHRAHALAQVVVDGGRGRLLHDLLVPALQGAVALAEVDDGAMLVGQHLDLDVTRIVDVALDVDGAVGEVGLALALCRRRARARPRPARAPP